MNKKLAYFGGEKTRTKKMPSRRAMGDLEKKKWNIFTIWSRSKIIEY